MRGATGIAIGNEVHSLVSIHAPHARGDQRWPLKARRTPCFNSRPSCEGRHVFVCRHSRNSVFQFTPLMRGATDRYVVTSEVTFVSIHAPHARGDSAPNEGDKPINSFNSRPSCEGRLRTARESFILAGFNSRPSCEGRHDEIHPYQVKAMFQFTPLMRGATCQLRPYGVALHVSIHAPHARGDIKS